jgi:cytochrome c oxidase cbb3-type subunit 1
LIGMVVFFSAAGYLGGSASIDSTPAEVEKIVKPILATMGIFGTMVLLANFIWAYNLFRTCAGWEKN